jgi:hypothetical protein
MRTAHSIRDPQGSIAQHATTNHTQQNSSELSAESCQITGTGGLQTARRCAKHTTIHSWRHSAVVRSQRTHTTTSNCSTQQHSLSLHHAPGVSCNRNAVCTFRCWMLLHSIRPTHTTLPTTL